MSRYISTIIRVLAFLLPIALISQVSEKSTEGLLDTSLDMDSLIAEEEAFLNWIEDPLDELGLDFPSSVIWSTSLAIGPGHSSNFLKREIPASSSYVKLESDFFINALLEKSSFTALVYVEGIQYDFDSQIDKEAIVLLHANWMLFTASWEFGTEFDAFLGDQIYDSSLSSNAQPVGERLRQVRPDLALFVERDFGQKDSVRLILDTERVLYERSEDDYWHPGIKLEWTREWQETISTTTGFRYFEELYDENVSRDRRGFTRPAKELLLIRGYAAEEEFSWNPSFFKPLELTLQAGASYEEDTAGEYDEAIRLWSSIITDLDLAWLDLRLIGRWRSTRYKYRQLDFFDERRQWQNYLSLRVEAKKSLPWDLAIHLAFEWEDFNSRIEVEQFSERRVETLLSWSY